jgi:hypothetical protein
MNFNNVLKSKYLYYAAVALMVINVLGYVSLGSIECVLALGGAAYLANHFTKNRTVDIFIGLFVSNILFGCGRLKEGMADPKVSASKAAANLSNKSKEAALKGNKQKAVLLATTSEKINKAVDECVGTEEEIKRCKNAKAESFFG